MRDPGGVRGGTYQLVVRGELGDRFASAFEGMDLEPLEGTTVLTGGVPDQAHLMGLIEQIQELGLELVSVTPVEERAHGTRGTGSRS